MNRFIEHWEVKIPEFQIPLGLFSKSNDDLTQEEKEFLEYFIMIRSCCIEPVISKYYPLGPKGYGISLILSRILKVKEHISSDRELASKLRKNEIYRVVCQLRGENTPSHNIYNTLRSKLEIHGYIELHINFVKEADKLGLLTPHINGFPKNMRE